MELQPLSGLDQVQRSTLKKEEHDQQGKETQSGTPALRGTTFIGVELIFSCFLLDFDFVYAFFCTVNSPDRHEMISYNFLIISWAN